jgi:hypothetical protein
MIAVRSNSARSFGMAFPRSHVLVRSMARLAKAGDWTPPAAYR